MNHAITHARDFAGGTVVHTNWIGVTFLVVAVLVSIAAFLTPPRCPLHVIGRRLLRAGWLLVLVAFLILCVGGFVYGLHMGLSGRIAPIPTGLLSGSFVLVIMRSSSASFSSWSAAYSS